MHFIPLFQKKFFSKNYHNHFSFPLKKNYNNQEKFFISFWNNKNNYSILKKNGSNSLIHYNINNNLIKKNNIITNLNFFDNIKKFQYCNSFSGIFKSLI